MDWKPIFSNPPAQVALQYRSGSRRSPDGESLLVVKGNGEATLDVWRGDSHENFSKALSAPEALTIFGLLGATGYPVDHGRTVPPGAGLVAVEVVGVPESLPTLLHRSYLNELPGWPALISRLDAICRRLSTGANSPGPKR